MELWEGAILVVGGIWLVGRMSRNSPMHPVNVAAASGGSDGSGGLNPTTTTNTDGTASLTVGEPIGYTKPLIPTSQPPAKCTSCFHGTSPFRPQPVGGGGHPVVFGPVRAPVMSKPVAGSTRTIPHFTTAPVRGGAAPGSVVSLGTVHGVQPSPKARFFAV